MNDLLCINCFYTGGVEISKLFLSTNGKSQEQLQLTLYINCHNCQEKDVPQTYYYLLSEYAKFLIKNIKQKNPSSIKGHYDYINNELINKSKLIQAIPFTSLNAFYDKYRQPLNSYESKILEYTDLNYKLKDNKEIIEQLILHYLDMNKQLYCLLEILFQLYFKTQNKSNIPFLLVKSLHYLCSIITPQFPIFNKSLICKLNQPNLFELPYICQPKIQYKRHPNNLNFNEITFKTHKSPITSLCQLKCGLIISGSYKLLNVYQYSSNINEYVLAFSNTKVVRSLPAHIVEINGQGIVAIASCNDIIEYNPTTDQIITTYSQVHQHQINCVKCIKYGLYLISCSIDKTTKIINRKTHVVEQTINSRIHSHLHHLLYYDLNASTKVLITVDNQIDIYKDNYPFPSFTHLQTLNDHKTIINVVIKIDSNRFVSGSYGTKANLIIYKYNTNQKKFELDVILYGHIEAVYSLLYLKQNKFLMSGCRKGSIRVWDLTTNQCITVFNLNFNYINVLIQLHDGRIGCGCFDHIFHIFNSVRLLNDKPNYNRDTGINKTKVKYNFTY